MSSIWDVAGCPAPSELQAFHRRFDELEAYYAALPSFASYTHGGEGHKDYVHALGCVDDYCECAMGKFRRILVLEMELASMGGWKKYNLLKYS